jgi:hypothetical protein
MGAFVTLFVSWPGAEAAREKTAGVATTPPAINEEVRMKLRRVITQAECAQPHHAVNPAKSRSCVMGATKSYVTKSEKPAQTTRQRHGVRRSCAAFTSDFVT